MITDDTGTAVWSAWYEPFGKAVVTDNQIDPVVFNLRFPGQYYDSETGLHYNWNRYYDPMTGRYVSSDPIGLEGGLNSYLYATANPLTFVDPYGLWAIGDPLPQSVVDVAAGWGDGISGALTFGFYSTADIRQRFGIDDAVNHCSDAYRQSEVVGQLQGALTAPGAAAKGLARLSRLEQLRWLNQNRYLRFGLGKPGPGMSKVDMMRIGPSPWNIGTRTRAWWTHWRL
jgi:RHS repeat-associated protein